MSDFKVPTIKEIRCLSRRLSRSLKRYRVPVDGALFIPENVELDEHGNVIRWKSISFCEGRQGFHLIALLGRGPHFSR